MTENSTNADRVIVIAKTAAVIPDFANIDAIFAGWCVAGTSADALTTVPAAASLCRLTLDALKSSGGFAPSTGLLLATTKGEMADQVAWMRGADAGDVSPPPTLEQPLHRLTTTYGLQGPSYVVSTACTSGLIALIDAALLLLDGDTDEMIALGVDVAGDFVHDGFHALHAISPTCCRPFDSARDGLTLGSAAAGALLSHGTWSVAHCILSGWGISNDATHMTAPDRNAGGLIRAIRQALEQAKIAAADIDVIFTHGTGTRYNDAMECVAIDAVFLQQGCSPAVTAVKGFLGHTLGAAGIIEAVLAVEMLHRQTIPPIHGLRSPERSDIDFVRTVRRCPIRHVLKIASGFGGMNAAVVLSRGGATSL